MTIFFSLLAVAALATVSLSMLGATLVSQITLFD